MAISHKAIKQAIIDHRGNITRVAESFGVSRQAITKRVNKSSTLKETLADARDMRNDSVRDTLYSMAVDDRVPSAAIFIAKTQMGWKETRVNEHTGKDGGAIAFIDYGLTGIDDE